MKIINLGIVTISLLIVFALPFRGQNRQSINRAQYATTTLEPQFTMLPRNFIGHDLEKIQQILSDRYAQLSKGEFETMSSFEARLETEKQTTLIGNLKLKDYFIFSFSPTNTEYNADKQIFTLEFNGYREKLHWRKRKIAEKRYVGQNAFNIKMVVREQTFHGWNLIVNETDQENCILNPLLSYASKQCFQRSLTLPIPPSQAIKIKNDIRLFVMARIVFPYVTQQIRTSTATLDSPYAKNETSYYVHIKPKSSGLYNLTTGEILTHRTFAEIN